ncbi:MAG: dephospho-CoA kinase, partial [Nitrospira sp.]
AREQQRLTRQAARSDPSAIVIYDVPLLFEAGIDTRVDKIVVVTADRETQIARLNTRNGLSRSEALRRIRSQLPMNRKSRLADFVLDGTKDTRRLTQDVAKICKNLRSL